jgi:hypothetical protein
MPLRENDVKRSFHHLTHPPRLTRDPYSITYQSLVSIRHAAPNSLAYGYALLDYSEKESNNKNMVIPCYDQS